MATIKKPIKKAATGTNLKKDVRNIAKDKTSLGPKRNIAKDIKAERTTVANKNKAITNSYNKQSTDYKNEAKKLKQASFDFRYEQQMGEAMGRTPERSQELSKFSNKESKTKDSLSTVYANKAKESVKNPKYKPALKNGGSVKAKDGNWIQSATASIKKRGTKGVCTGSKFGGPTCKPGSKRYNLAKVFKGMAKAKKKK